MALCLVVLAGGATVLRYTSQRPVQNISEPVFAVAVPEVLAEAPAVVEEAPEVPFIGQVPVPTEPAPDDPDEGLEEYAFHGGPATSPTAKKSAGGYPATPFAGGPSDGSHMSQQTIVYAPSFLGGFGDGSHMAAMPIIYAKTYLGGFGDGQDTATMPRL